MGPSYGRRRHPAASEADCPGIAVAGDLALNNALVPQWAETNSGIAIDLGDDGPTPNGVHSPPGPNNWLPYPVFTTVSGSQVAGTTCSGCMVAVYNSIIDPRSPGGGGLYLGSTTADASGHWTFSIPAPYNARGASAIACANTCATPNDSSEMSPMLHLAFIPFARRR